MTGSLILIVEDEPEIAEILEGYFAREGFRVICARDGTTGLAHHQTLRPDLVVLDIKLPGKDGFEVLAAIRRSGETPVIMVTAFGRGSRTSCRRSGSGPMITWSSRSTPARWSPAPVPCCADDGPDGKTLLRWACSR